LLLHWDELMWLAVSLSRASVASTSPISCGLRSYTRAITPAMWGEAMLVPDSVA
jgi:hypothetical protein